jgi:thymidylate synthase ThyX
MNRPLAVSLISYSTHPLGTLFYVWEQSRSNNRVPLPKMLEFIMTDSTEAYPGKSKVAQALRDLGETETNADGYMIATKVRKRILDMVNQILDEDIPCTENLDFVFAIENMSISLREQMVRHRIGVTIGERLGIDIVPDQAKSSWWSQTMRMLPMDNFFSEGRFILPEGLEGKVCKDAKAETYDTGIGEHEGMVDCDALELYIELMRQIEFVYQKLIQAGVAMEDARQIIPIGATHSITWKVNLKSLMHILGKRACWVAQANLWEELISGMINQMCEVVHPIFRKIIQPPCFKKGRYNSCPYFQINKERVQGRDRMPPCPLYVYHETQIAVCASKGSVMDTSMEATWTPPHDDRDPRYVTNWDSTKDDERRQLDENLERFKRLWKLDVFTGEPVNG